MRFQRRLRCSNIPSPRTFWGASGLCICTPTLSQDTLWAPASAKLPKLRRFLAGPAQLNLVGAGQLARVGHYRGVPSAVVIAERLRSLTSFGDPPSGPAKVTQPSVTDPGRLA